MAQAETYYHQNWEDIYLLVMMAFVYMRAIIMAIAQSVHFFALGTFAKIAEILNL